MAWAHGRMDARAISDRLSAAERQAPASMRGPHWPALFGSPWHAAKDHHHCHSSSLSSFSTAQLSTTPVVPTPALQPPMTVDWPSSRRPLGLRGPVRRMYHSVRALPRCQSPPPLPIYETMTMTAPLAKYSPVPLLSLVDDSTPVNARWPWTVSPARPSGELGPWGFVSNTPHTEFTPHASTYRCILCVSLCSWECPSRPRRPLVMNPGATEPSCLASSLTAYRRRGRSSSRSHIPPPNPPPAPCLHYYAAAKFHARVPPFVPGHGGVGSGPAPAT